MGLNDHLQDEFITHAVDLSKLDAGVRKQVLGTLHQLGEELQTKIQDLGAAGADSNSHKVAKLNQFLKTTNTTIDAAYQNVAEGVKNKLVDVGSIANKKALNILNAGFQTPLAKGTLTKDDLIKSLGNTMIQGHPAQAWWDKQSVDTQNAFTAQMRMGYLQGESVQQLIQRVRGKYTGQSKTVVIDGKAKTVKDFAGGIMQVSSRDAEALVRTAVQTMANKVHNDTYDANADIIKAKKAVATLDARTTPVCRHRDGAIWDMKGNPTKASPVQQPFPGPPPWHFNCRTILVPVTKSWAELIEEKTGKKMPGLPDVPTSTRASMDGQVPANLTYEQWLKTKSEAFQKDVLGDAKWQMWKEGKVTFSQMVDTSGRPYTVKQLQNLYQIEGAAQEKQQQLDESAATINAKADATIEKSVQDRINKYDNAQVRSDMQDLARKHATAAKQAADALKQSEDHQAAMALARKQASDAEAQAQQARAEANAALAQADAMAAQAKADAEAKAIADAALAKQAEEHAAQVKAAKKKAYQEAQAAAEKEAADYKAMAKAQMEAAAKKYHEEEAAKGKAAVEAATLKAQQEHDAQMAAIQAQANADRAAAEAAAIKTKAEAEQAKKELKDTKAKVAANPPAFPDSVTGLKVVKKLGGSTGAELVEDEHGQKFVRKYGASAEHVREEFAAEEMYRAGGVAVPPSRVYTDAAGKPVKLSVFIDGKIGSETNLAGNIAALPKASIPGAMKERDALQGQLQSGFAMDALMGNWDAMGTGFDNVLLGKDGVVHRIDVGGSLRFRAQGALKTKDQWNAYPVELWTLRDKKKNPGVETNMFGVMRGIDHDQLVAQIDGLLGKRAQIMAATPDDLKEIIGQRLDAMAKVSKTTKTFKTDAFTSDYASDFTWHQMGINKAGVTARLPQQMAHKSKGDVHLYDENGKAWDDMRGKDSVVTALAKYVNDNGGDYDLIDAYNSGQGGSSWSGTPVAVKYWWTGQRGKNPQTSYYWNNPHGDDAKGYEHARSQYTQKAGAKPEVFNQSFTALHAYTYEMLNTTQLPNVDAAKGIVRLVRTEDKSVIDLHKMKKGDTKVLIRGACESTSLVRAVEVKGSELTVQDVPLTRIMSTYMHSGGPGSGKSNTCCLYGDSENEFTAMLEGIPATYLDKKKDFEYLPGAPVAKNVANVKASTTYSNPVASPAIPYAQKAMNAGLAASITDAKPHLGDSGLKFSSLAGVPGSNENYQSYKKGGGKAETLSDFLNAYFTQQNGVWTPKPSKYSSNVTPPTPGPVIKPAAAMPAAPPVTPAASMVTAAPAFKLTGTAYDKKVAAVEKIGYLWNAKNSLKDPVSPKDFAPSNYKTLLISEADDPLSDQKFFEAYKSNGGVLTSYTDYLKAYFMQHPGTGAVIIKPQTAKEAKAKGLQ